MFLLKYVYCTIEALCNLCQQAQNRLNQQNVQQFYDCTTIQYSTIPVALKSYVYYQYMRGGDDAESMYMYHR